MPAPNLLRLVSHRAVRNFAAKKQLFNPVSNNSVNHERYKKFLTFPELRSNGSGLCCYARNSTKSASVRDFLKCSKLDLFDQAAARSKIVDQCSKKLFTTGGIKVAAIFKIGFLIKLICISADIQEWGIKFCGKTL